MGKGGNIKEIIPEGMQMVRQTIDEREEIKVSIGDSPPIKVNIPEEPDPRCSVKTATNGVMKVGTAGYLAEKICDKLGHTSRYCWYGRVREEENTVHYSRGNTERDQSQ